MKYRSVALGALYTVLLTVFPAFIAHKLLSAFLVIPLSLAVFVLFVKTLIKPSNVQSPLRRLVTLYNGIAILQIHALSFAFIVVLLLVFRSVWTNEASVLIVCGIPYLILSLLLMLCGCIRMVISSLQLGIIQRLCLFFMWWIPIINIFVIIKACNTAYYEYVLESDRLELDEVRKESEVCCTKYPLLLVHGVFFRDLKFFNYWGRIPKELIKNGAVIYYGEQHSAASVAFCANELKEKIEKIVSETGCQKVNIIAHSKGGLDSRYAISVLGMNKYVASLTTISTPHRGCGYADYLLGKAPKTLKDYISDKYNTALRSFGEKDPDFIAAVSDLTQKHCQDMNETALDCDDVYYQSVGSRMKNYRSAGFPMNIVYIIARNFSKNDNDGLVDTESMKWGERHIFFEPKTHRGISHGDTIDLLREDIKGFDIREEYVSIVHGLKEMGF